MKILLVLTLMFFQISMLAITYFIVEFAIDWFKKEDVIGKTYVFSTAFLLTIACVSVFIATFFELLQML